MRPRVFRILDSGFIPLNRHFSYPATDSAVVYVFHAIAPAQRHMRIKVRLKVRGRTKLCL